MSKVPEPKDCVGNILLKDDLVVVQFLNVPIFKIIAVEHGGLHTANGMTPALIRVVSDISLRQMPGIPFMSLAKVLTPSAQQLIEGLTDLLNKS